MDQRTTKSRFAHAKKRLPGRGRALPGAVSWWVLLGEACNTQTFDKFILFFVSLYHSDIMQSDHISGTLPL